jgi:hypothetical protein
MTLSLSPIEHLLIFEFLIIFVGHSDEMVVASRLSSAF